MTAPSSIDPARFLHEQLASASPGLLRLMLTHVLQHADSAEADAICGAGYGERSAERGQRAQRLPAPRLDTRAGTLDVAIPKLREGSYFPDWLLERGPLLKSDQQALAASTADQPERPRTPEVSGIHSRVSSLVNAADADERRYQRTTQARRCPRGKEQS